MIAPSRINVEKEPALNAKRVEYIKRLIRGDYRAEWIDGPILRQGRFGCAYSSGLVTGRADDAVGKR